MAKLGAMNYSIQKTTTTKPITVHVDHLKLFHTANRPAAWSEERSGSHRETRTAERDSDDGAGSAEGAVLADGDDNIVGADDDETQTCTYRSCTLRNRRLPGRFKDYYMG